MASNDLQIAFTEIADLRSLPQEMIVGALQEALVSAYRKFMGISKSQIIEARIDTVSGRARIFAQKEVVSEKDDFFSPVTEVTLEDARYYDPECQIGDLVMVQEENTPKSFGRIAAQTAKQIILQKIREAERKNIYNEFLDREGDLITGTVQSISASLVTLGLGRAEAILQRTQQIPGEKYHPHQKLRVYVVEVKNSPKGPQIICSRSHRNMLRRLLEYEVPEIFNKQVEIKSIAREAGYRSKVAVVALQEGIDPVGACVGMKGIRIQNIVKELHDEKIDVIEWNPYAEQFITKALSPATVAGVYLEEDEVAGRTALVIVEDRVLSLAIGKEGQNARLAAKLTGWRIDIKSVTETVQGALENLDVPPLNEFAYTHAEMVESVRMILEKIIQKRVVQPEEYNLMAKFANLVEKRLWEDRESERRDHRQQFEAVRATVPPQLFKLPISRLNLSEEINEALQPFDSVGHVIVSMLIDEYRLEQILSRDGMKDAMDKVRVALDMVMETEDFDELFEDSKPEVVVVETVVQPVVEETEDEERDAFGGKVVAKPAPTVAPATEEAVTEEDYENYGYNYDDDSDDEEGTSEDRKKKDKKKNRRQLIYDEDSGEVRTKRQRKNSGRGAKGGWGDYD
jgi:transcription termination/antitermination protein NusA